MHDTSVSPSEILVNELRIRIDGVIGMIPDSYRTKRKFVAALTAHRTSLPYTAPEALSRLWRDVGDTIDRHLPNKTKGGWPADAVQYFSRRV